MSAEAGAAIGILKWLVGLILAPWLWHERKRVDTLQKSLAERFTKEEVKEQIELRNRPIIDKLDLIYEEIKTNRERKDNANK